MNKNYCVISHTHWDREWYLPFELFRLRLVDLMDNLLDILETEPAYIFHLDAQSVILEDYLQIKPYKKELIKQYIQEGRLLVGPWYVQNDFYLTSGEATIRNLIIGIRIAEDMGKSSFIGYAPDQFGLISQLPQILNGFGIDNCIFGRGYAFLKDVEGKKARYFKPVEFMWQSPDGSKVLAVHLPFWYNNAQRFTKKLENNLMMLESLEKRYEEISMAPELLLMNGVDHLEAQEDLLPILEQIQRSLPEGKKIYQGTMQHYIDTLKEHIRGNEKISKKLITYMGEMRNGPDTNILQGTLSSRIYIKKANTQVQNMLEKEIEPIYSLIHAAGFEGIYPADFMTYLWQELIKNHAHDSICGCSRDEVHKQMEDRYERIDELGHELLKRGMDLIVRHIDRDMLSKNDSLITVFNTHYEERSDVICAELYFLQDDSVSNFIIQDSNGRVIPYTAMQKEIKSRGSISPVNLPGTRIVDAYTIQFFAENVPALGYDTYIVSPCPGECVIHNDDEIIETADLTAENEFMKVEVSYDGKINAFDKQNGHIYEDIFYFEDAADAGDVYVFKKAENDTVFTSRALKPEMKYTLKTDFETRIAITYQLLLPACYDDDRRARSQETETNKVVVTLGLKKGNKVMHINFNIDNRSCDHRLRAIFKTGIAENFTYSSIPFDIIKRDNRKVLEGSSNGDQPNSGLICLENKDRGVAVVNEGIFEYEHLLGDEGLLAITLVRANEYISKTMVGGSVYKIDEFWHVPGNQCIRNIELDAGISFYTGDFITNNIKSLSDSFQNPMLVCYQPVDMKIFDGGRPVVQASGVAETFFRDDPFKNIILPYNRKLIELKGSNIQLSALKKAEKGNSLVVRVYNSAPEEREFALKYYKPYHSVKRINLNEEFIENIQIEMDCTKPVKIKSGEIQTLLID